MVVVVVILEVVYDGSNSNDGSGSKDGDDQNGSNSRKEIRK